MFSTMKSISIKRRNTTIPFRKKKKEKVKKATLTLKLTDVVKEGKIWGGRLSILKDDVMFPTAVTKHPVEIT